MKNITLILQDGKEVKATVCVVGRPILEYREKNIPMERLEYGVFEEYELELKSPLGDCTLSAYCDAYTNKLKQMHITSGFLTKETWFSMFNLYGEEPKYEEYSPCTDLEIVFNDTIKLSNEDTINLMKIRPN